MPASNPSLQHAAALLRVPVLSIEEYLQSSTQITRDERLSSLVCLLYRNLVATVVKWCNRNLAASSTISLFIVDHAGFDATPDLVRVNNGALLRALRNSTSSWFSRLPLELSTEVCSHRSLLPPSIQFSPFSPALSLRRERERISSTDRDCASELRTHKRTQNRQQVKR